MIRILSLLCCLLMFVRPVYAGSTPGDSLYQLEPQLVNQDGKSIPISVYRGYPTVISMFYGSCPNVCPMLIASIRHFEKQLDEPTRDGIRVMLISIDPERDTPDRLKALAQRHGVDLTRWTFAKAGANDVRVIAAALGIRYRTLPDGEFNHATVVSLVDSAGRIVRQTSSITGKDPEFLASLRKEQSKRSWP